MNKHEDDMAKIHMLARIARLEDVLSLVSDITSNAPSDHERLIHDLASRAFEEKSHATD